MRKKNWKFLSSGALALLLVTASGCEAVQGYEINQALQKNVSMTSGESRGSLSIELVPGSGSTLSSDEKSMFDLLQNAKFTIKDAKTQDRTHASIDAEFTYSKGTIPFKLVVADSEIMISIEGAKKPIVFHNTPASLDLASALLQNLQKDLQKKATEFLPSAAKFVIANAPNPDHISVSQTTYQVNGESLNLQQLHTEIYGDELAALIKGFLTNILADKEGMKELIGQLYDAFVPTIKAAISAAQENSSHSSSARMDLISSYLDNKTLAVEFAYTFIQQKLQTALKDWDKNLEESKSSEDQALLTHQAYAKLDLFIDQDQWIRKQNVELRIPLDEKSSIAAIKVTGSSETWNNNKPITSDSIDLSAGQLEFGLDNEIKEYTLFNNLDKNSQFYKLLKNDLQVTKKQITLKLAANDMDTKIPTPFIDSSGVTMVPARYVTEQFGAEVQWNGALNEITVIDNITGAPIVFKIDSNTAYVNGTEVHLESPAILKNSSTYVPLRFLSDALGSKLDWDESTHTIHISRD
jgi:hypothetical protein